MAFVNLTLAKTEILAISALIHERALRLLLLAGSSKLARRLDAETLFLKGNVVAIGWGQFGNLGQCQTREQYRSQYAKVYPQHKPGAVPVNAGQLYRFAREMKVDLVAYLSKLTREIHIGRSSVTMRTSPKPALDTRTNVP